MDNKNNQGSDLEFEEMMKNKLSSNFKKPTSSNAASANDARLKEMNKKLPAWNLEPPFIFIK
ncbi:MAG: hypothetical protein R3Y27_04770 [Clostridia bacterium]